MASRLMTLADLFGADLSVFYDPFDSSTISQASGAVNKIADESVAGGARPGGTPVNANQANNTYQPTYSATGLAGNPAIVGNGSQYLDISPVTGLPTGQSDVTMFALIQGSAGYGSNSVVLSWGSAGNGVEHLFGFGNGSPNWWYTDRGGGSGDVHGTSDVTAAPSLCILTLDATGSNLAIEMRVNSIVEATGSGTAASFGSDGGRLLYTINDYCNPAKCAFGAIGVVRRTLTDDEKQKLEGILLWRQGVQTASGGPLPSSHPYYSAAPTVTTGGTTYASTLTLSATAYQAATPLMAGVSAAAVRAAAATTAIGGLACVAPLALASVGALAATVAATANGSVGLRAAPAHSTAATCAMTSALSIAATAAALSAPGLTASAALALAEIAGASSAGAITTAQVAALAMALASATSGRASVQGALSLAGAALTGAAAQAVMPAAAAIAAAPGQSSAGGLNAVGAINVGQAEGVAGSATVAASDLTKLASALGALAAPNGAQAYVAAATIAATVAQTAAATGTMAAVALLPERFDLTGQAAALFAGAVALGQAQAEGAQAQAVAVAAAALAEAFGSGANSGSQAYTAAAALAARALAAADARSGAAALAAIAHAPAAGATASASGAAGAALSSSVGHAVSAVLAAVAGATFQATTRIVGTGSLVVNGTLTLPAVSATDAQPNVAIAQALAFTAHLDKAATAALNAGAAAQLAAQAALEVLLQSGPNYDGLPTLQGVRVVTLSLEGRRMGMRTLAGTMRLTLHAPTRH